VVLTPIFKPRDKVRTPAGRLAEVVDLTPDGKRVLMYLDGDHSYVTLERHMLHMVEEAQVRPWPSTRAPT